MKKCIMTNVLFLNLVSFVQLSQATQLPGPSIHDVLPDDMQRLIVAKAFKGLNTIKSVKTYQTLEITSKKFKSLLESKVKKDLEIVKVCILRGYIENFADAWKDYAKRRFFKGALLWAVDINDYPALWLMLNEKNVSKLDINERDKNGWTALHYVVSKVVVSKAPLKMLKKLLKHKPKLDVVDNIGQTALDYAALQGNLEMVKELLQHIPNINKLDPKGSSLHNAIQEGHYGVVKELLIHNIALNTPDKNGRTALHLAVTKGHLIIVHELLKHNPNIQKTDNNGETPLRMARREGFKEIEKEIYKHKTLIGLGSKTPHERNLNWARYFILVKEIFGRKFFYY